MPMIIETLQALFTRDLNRLKNEIELYGNENNLWKIEKNIANSAGNLCLHLVGNLNTYIGKEIGQTVLLNLFKNSWKKRARPSYIAIIAARNQGETENDLPLIIMVSDFLSIGSMALLKEIYNYSFTNKA